VIAFAASSHCSRRLLSRYRRAFSTATPAAAASATTTCSSPLVNSGASTLSAR
jgi:hypothetical protein